MYVLGISYFKLYRKTKKQDPEKTQRFQGQNHNVVTYSKGVTQAVKWF